MVNEALDAQERRRLTTRLLLIAGALVLLHLLSLFVGERSWQLERTFDVDLESNIPTWFSSGLFALAALAAYGCARASGASPQRKAWLVLASALLFMSCDEVAMLHENLDGVLRRHVFGVSLQSHFPFTSWPVLVGPFLLVGLVWLAWNLRAGLRGSSRAARLLILGACIFFAGSAGLELTANLFVHEASLQWWRAAEIVLEESLEMLGMITVLSGLLLHQQMLQQRTIPAHEVSAS